MMSRMIRYTMISVFGLALAGHGAFAQETPEEGGGTEGGGEEGGAPAEGGGEATPAEGTPSGGEAMAEGDMGGKPPMLLAKGKLGVTAQVGVNLSKELVAKPIFIAPDVWYGVMPKLEVGVAHSTVGLNGWWSPVGFGGGGAGLCVTGKDNGCAKFYNGPIGVLAHYLLMEGNIDLAADGGLVIRQLSDPMLMALKVGVKGRWMSGKIAVMFNPSVGIGLNKRSDAGNKEILDVPVTVGYMVSPKLHAGIQTGITGFLDPPVGGFGDFYSIPLGVGAMFAVNNNLSVAGSFMLTRVAGFEGPGAADGRFLSVFAMWHN